jgi:carbon monoxide dehydrogenase subunit G
MKWMARVLGGLVGLCVVLVAGLWLVGLRPGHGHVAAEVEIARPAPEVFHWLNDDERVKKWISGLVEIKKLSSGENGGEVGSKFRMSEVYGGEQVEMVMRVTGFELNRSIEMEVWSVGDPKNGFTEKAKYTLTEQGGKTRLALEAQAKYFGFLPRLFEPVMTPAATKKLHDDFQRLKSLAEAEAK